jgi:hypothetical protein
METYSDGNVRTFKINSFDSFRFGKIQARQNYIFNIIKKI